MANGNGSTVKWAGVAITILVLVASAFSGWAYNNASTARNTKDIRDHEGRIRITEKAMNDLSRDVKWIVQTMQEERGPQ